MAKIESQNWDGTTSSLGNPSAPTPVVVAPTSPTVIQSAPVAKKKSGIGKILLILLVLLGVGIGAYYLLNNGGDVMKKASSEQASKISMNAGAMVQGFLHNNTETVTNMSKEFANTLNEMGIKAKDFTSKNFDQMLNSMNDNVKQDIISGMAEKLHCAASDITLTVKDGVIIPVINGVENMACKIDLSKAIDAVKANLQELQK